MREKKPAISIKNVRVTYRSGIPLTRATNEYTPLKDISFDLYEGDSLGIIGRNGAGKSTLLRLLNGIIKPNDGKIINYGHKTALLSLTVGYDQNLTGRQNAVISGMMMGLNKRHIVSKLEEINEFAELGKFFDQPIKNYSTGMKQRLGFGVAIHLKPDILLIDEILAVGDTRFKKKSEAVMKEKITSGDTVVLVSHSPTTIKRLCNKALWIEDGIVAKYGDSTKVVEEYENSQR
ncbi:ABC transporter ATP-binding protein [Microbulbifer thermotolerans]|uniref:ABC transporter ATP-binding protein n=1 Tax=Microbulbifer thermotolerans TaxID=252514 RepID=A0AB35HT49_MICTH|nr:ABC transporter ATP-binding protein [Microbulbifer thermotolerans]MCX2779822.1 ABC transporter ATP-binding protein [Microbulbifer thermotolerans]MCX2800399.1 ABC transporter ATP-binding protein [Microbulbifer thermotolerans]MCX2805006.1 ABC transporter ATP-binding protein [Microbulbifer thermotolerans]WKT59078.1 ABC transporter ATP-binding protein [Microbulbifer thermotolerans]